MTDFGARLESESKKTLLVKILSIDWVMFISALLISLAGLVTMNSFLGNNSFFQHQFVWLVVSVIIFFVFSLFDFHFLRRTSVVVSIYVFACLSLLALFSLGMVTKGSQSWFSFGGVSFQPAELAKISVIILLAKYFSRRHIEIANFRHILVSGIYALIVFILVFLQPDFGSAFIIFMIWLGMVLLSGLSKKHLFIVLALGSIVFSALWFGGILDNYQKLRIKNFLNPTADIRGTGYNAYQSTIAVGSGQVLGKGIGYGTQSKLKFLPEYQTDFIFAAFSEEWGFVGVTLLFGALCALIWRVIANAFRGSTNFEILFGVGLATLFVSHFVLNAGMNIGLLPVTGVTFPFMSYGGTHLLISFASLGILNGMRRYQKTAHNNKLKNEFFGL